MSRDITFEELLEIKRDGGAHSREEIDRLVLGFSTGEMPDYQMSAWLMAAYLNGLTDDETVWLTDAMVRSGRVVDLSSIPGVKVDKHSTGGVADTTTLVLAPLVAACGVPVAKMSGRGLGHTGGTLDKLDSIPGFVTELTPEEFVSQVRDIGIAVIAQSPDVDPADKALYALRDVTATVPSVPLIVGSIISKKIAGGADAIVLDVKVGSGAFMKTLDQARNLARELTRVGGALGRRVECLLTDMDQPLGMAVGNALEVEEAIQTLSGHGPPALTELCLIFGERMLILGGRASGPEEARALLVAAIDSGAAVDKFREWIVAQGGDGRVATDTTRLPRASMTREVRAETLGFVQGFDAEGVGRAAMITGAGRLRKEDRIDPGAGLLLAVRTGDRVEPGSLLCTLYSSSDELLNEAESRFMESIRLGPEAVEPPPLVLHA
jgi:pyrimidine-nucleoside phosphorylase